MKTIVIVEDDAAIQNVLKTMLESIDYKVIICFNGEPIFNKEVKPLPDLFILDKQISGADGLEVCKFLKQDVQTQAIPVIMLSASPHARKMAELAGADAFLEKPFSMKELREMIARHINSVAQA